MPASRPLRSRLPPAAPAAALAALAAALLFPGRASAPAFAVVAVAAVWAAWRAPLRHTLLVLLFLVLAADNPDERPFAGLWQSPFHRLGEALFVNLRKSVGIEGLGVSPLDLALLGLAGLLALRLLSDRRGNAGQGLGASCLLPALLASLAGLALWELWGLSRGGDARSSLWQLRQLAFLPVLALLFAAALERPRDLRALGAVVLLAAACKAALGLWFHYAVARPDGLQPAYLTSHADSLLFTLALVAALANAWERRTAPSALLLAGFAPLMLWAMWLNDRRIAWVELPAALATLYLVSPNDARKRALRRLALIAAPVLLLYAAAGWSSSAPAFGPVQAVRSVLTESDLSSMARRVESDNLIVTLRQNLPLGTGFGHPYLEHYRGDSIAEHFELWAYIPHNAVLGLWAFAGPLGFALIWMPLVVAFFLAARALRFAQTPLQRLGGQLCAAALAIFALQAWGDMGLTSWSAAFLAAAAIGGASRLAAAAGAWPAPSPRAEAIARPQPFPGATP